MNNKDNEVQSSQVENISVASEELAIKFSKRRRFIKLGASTAPVALTLTSRPVLAWHCNTTSAWGSEQIRPNQSTTTRNNQNELPDETWTIANWEANSTRAGLNYPWAALGKQTTKPSQPNYYKNYKISELYAPYGGIPAGLYGADGVWDKISNGTDFQKYMIVARLNSKLIANVRTCLSNSNNVDQLSLMGSGQYSPSNLPSTVWDENKIKLYLYNNWIVRPF